MVTQKTTVKRVHADLTTKGSSGLKYHYNHKGFQMLYSLLLGPRASCCWLTYDLKMLSSAALKGFPGGSDGKASACNVGDPGSIPGLGRSPEEGNGSPLQYSCLENPMDRGA